MGSEVYLFNLPPIITCTPTNWCLYGKDGKPSCYALRNNFMIPSVIKSAKKRYEISKKDNFVELMIQEIKRKKPRYFRFHSSGDFYSEAYVKKVIDIADACPKILFRTTTRRRDLSSIIQELNSLPNFIVRESFDTEITKSRMNLPFTALSCLDITKEKDVYHCKENCQKCDYYCWKHRDNICYVEF